MPDAVVLLSGGLDSATTLAITKASGYRPHALTFRYGQRHEAEIDAARRIAATLGVVSTWWRTSICGPSAVPR